MLYDRPYMRETPVVKPFSFLKTFLIALLVVFVLQIVAERFVGHSFIDRHLAFSGKALGTGQIWTAVTYAFLHDTGEMTPWHLVFNMLAIFFIGRGLEPELGPRRMAFLATTGAVAGALLWVMIQLIPSRAISDSSDPLTLIGASAVATALITFFCLRRPEQSITLLLFFVIPLTMKPKWLLWGLLGIETFGFLMRELGGNSHVAHSAHLGGMLGGLFFFAYLRRADAAPPSSRRTQRPAWLRRKKPQKVVTAGGYTVNYTDSQSVQEEVDRILDKINHGGFASLTEKEKRTLDKARDHFEK